jgi:hypothetical protein
MLSHQVKDPFYQVYSKSDIFLSKIQFNIHMIYVFLNYSEQQVTFLYQVSLLEMLKQFQTHDEYDRKIYTTKFLTLVLFFLRFQYLPVFLELVIYYTSAFLYF